jgi:hypothetical protein
VIWLNPIKSSIKSRECLGGYLKRGWSSNPTPRIEIKQAASDGKKFFMGNIRNNIIKGYL